MSSTTIQHLHHWIGLSRLMFDEVLDDTQVSDPQIHDGTEMYQLKNLQLVEKPYDFPAQFFFTLSGEPVFLHVYNEDFLSQLSVQDIESFYGTAESEERSRAGKTSNYYVYATKGFAYSALRNKIHFVDIFPATSLENFLTNIYKAPGPFIR